MYRWSQLKCSHLNWCLLQIIAPHRSTNYSDLRSILMHIAIGLQFNQWTFLLSTFYQFRDPQLFLCKEIYILYTNVWILFAFTHLYPLPFLKSYSVNLQASTLSFPNQTHPFPPCHSDHQTNRQTSQLTTPTDQPTNPLPNLLQPRSFSGGG